MSITLGPTVILYIVGIIFLGAFFFYRSCKANSTAYGTLNLNRVFDAESSADYVKWPGLAAALDGLKTKRVHVDFDSDVGPPTSAVDVLKPMAESRANIDFPKFRSLVRPHFPMIRGATIK